MVTSGLEPKKVWFGLMATSSSYSTDTTPPRLLTLKSSLTVGADGSLWLVRNESLLRYHQGPRFDRFDRQSGLPVSEVTALVVDEQAHVWVGTTGGLVELDRDAKVVRTYQYEMACSIKR